VLATDLGEFVNAPGRPVPAGVPGGLHYFGFFELPQGPIQHSWVSQVLSARNSAKSLHQLVAVAILLCQEQQQSRLDETTHLAAAAATTFLFAFGAHGDLIARHYMLPTYRCQWARLAKLAPAQPAGSARDYKTIVMSDPAMAPKNTAYSPMMISG